MLCKWQITPQIESTIYIALSQLTIRRPPSHSEMVRFTWKMPTVLDRMKNPFPANGCGPATQKIKSPLRWYLANFSSESWLTDTVHACIVHCLLSHFRDAFLLLCVEEVMQSIIYVHVIDHLALFWFIIIEENYRLCGEIARQYMLTH